MKLISFDVFDTIITRKTANPYGIFAIMNYKLNTDKKYETISKHVRQNFYLIRINAERMARANFCNSDQQDISLKQIYQCIKTTGNLLDRDVQQLMTLEIQTEQTNIIGIQDNIQRIKEALSQNQKVILISEMYLSAEVLRQMLNRVDPCLIGLSLYVSSEYKKTKVGGGLYEEVKQAEQVDYKDWLHIGDNPLADIESAQALGIQTERYIYETLTESEAELLSKKEDNAEIQLLIGATRNLRISMKLNTNQKVGGCIGGPLFFGYIDWMLNECINKDIQRLYFIARDGYLLKEIADVLIRLRGYSVQTFYIYGSRKAWRIASLDKESFDFQKIIFCSFVGNEIVFNLQKYADVFQIDLKVFERYFHPIYVYKGILMEDEKKKIDSYLSQSSDFKNYILEEHKDKRVLFTQYLRQEVDVQDEKYAFVELSGSGFTQGCLANVMKEITDNPVRTFFYKLDWVDIVDNCINYNYFPINMELSYILEVFCRALHGGTSGYRRNDSIIEPILEEGEKQLLMEFGYEDFVDGVKWFTEQFDTYLQDNAINISGLDAPYYYWNRIISMPDKETMQFLSDMPFSVSGREREINRFAPVLTRKQIIEIFLIRMPGFEPPEKFYKGSSVEYSVMRSAKTVQKFVSICKKYNHSRMISFFREKRFKLLFGVAHKKNNYGLPVERLGNQIILYGAGKVGQFYYDKLCKIKNKPKLRWVDKNSELYRNKGLPVENLDIIYNSDFDTIMIAIKKAEVADQIIKELIGKGISQNKIVWLENVFTFNYK